VFNVTLRKGDTSAFADQEYAALLWGLWIVASCFYMYIVLNMTVAMTKTFLDQNQRIKVESQYQVMTQLTLDCFDKINIPKDETVLFAPERAEDFVEEVPQYDQDESRFKVRFRPNQFCN
jgi:hypothetical protein